MIQNGAADVNVQAKARNTPLDLHCVWLLVDKCDFKTTVKNYKGVAALMSGYVKFYSRPIESSRRAIAMLLQKVALE